ncbi:MAG: efflux RND transporter periplasmic adaptor subunit [Gammaproteobacteria bacterium]
MSVSALAQTQAALVRVDAVRSEPLAHTVDIIGRLVARRAGPVAARIDGPLESFEVAVGDRVGAGDVIAVLDAEALELEQAAAAARVAETRAKLQTAEAQLRLTEQERRRLERLKRTQSASKADYEDARQQELVAAARVREAEAAIALAGANLKMNDLALARTKILAPYAGVITQRLTEEGAYLQRGQDVVRMLADSLLEVEADVPYARLAGLAGGTEVTVRLDDGTEHRATVRAVVPEENRLTRTRAVRFTPSIGETTRPLAAGQSAIVMVPLGAPRNVLSVHKDAVTRRGAQSLVYVVEEEMAILRPVQLGEAIGERFEVLGGLESGEVVVIRGNERLQPNNKVRIEASEQPAQTPPA